VTKLTESYLSLPYTALAMVFVVVGFVTYYLLPLSFAINNFGLFLGTLTGILLSMILGMALIAQMLQGPIEPLVARLFLWGPNSALHTVVAKNLGGHSRRNSKTSFMVSMTVAFVLFAGAMFALQASSIQNNVKMFLGSDIIVFSPEFGGGGGDDDDEDQDTSGNTATTPTGVTQVASEEVQKGVRGADRLAVLPQRAMIRRLEGLMLPREAIPARGIGGRGALVAGYTFETFPLGAIHGRGSYSAA